MSLRTAASQGATSAFASACLRNLPCADFLLFAAANKKSILRSSAAKLGAVYLLAAAFCSVATAQTAHLASAWSGIGSGLQDPVGVAVDSSGNVYIADTANGEVEEIVGWAATPR